MQPRAKLAVLLSRHEGFRSKVYDDATGQPIGPGDTIQGHPTIGYGLALDVRGLTERQAARLRDDTLDELEHQLSLRVPNYGALDPVRQMALLNLAYQMGIDGVLGFRRMLHHLEMGNYDEARSELLTSKWARQTGAQRKADVAHMLTTGTWPE